MVIPVFTPTLFMPTVSGALAQLLSCLSSHSITAKLDRLWIFAQATTGLALVDIINSSTATVTGSPTFVANRGYTGDDSNSPTNYIDSGFNPTSGTPNYTQNSAHVSFWAVTSPGQSFSAAGSGIGLQTGGSTETDIFDPFTNDGNVYGRINDGTASGSQGAPGSFLGHWLVNRSGASASQLYQNGAGFSSPNAASGALINGTFYILAKNDTASGASAGFGGQVAMASIGGSLSSTDVTNFYNCLRAYMTAVGVP